MGAEAENPNPGAAPTNVPPTTPPTDDRPRDEQGRFHNPLQPRIDELTRDKHEARRERDYWRTRAEAAEKPKTEETPKPEAKPKPESKDFDSYDEYVEALADWKADTRATEKVQESFKQRDDQDREARVQQTRATTWTKSVEQAKQLIPDYDAVMDVADVQVAKHVTELLLDSERGAELAYQLAKQPELAKKLNSLDERQAARELGKLEAKLPDPASPEPTDDPAATKEDPPPAPKPAATTKPPPAPTKSLKSGASTTKDLSKMTMDEYVEARKAQGAKWARR